MSFFNPTQEERQAKLQRKKTEAELKARKEFAQTPAGRARKARRAGAKIFQVDVPISYTVGRTVAMLGAYASSTNTLDQANTIETIEAEGWKLEHVGYIYRITGSVSRDRFMASGQQEAMHGEIVGIYLFRATAEQPPSAGEVDIDAQDSQVTVDFR